MDRAFDKLGTIENRWEQTAALSAISSALVEVGRPEEAIEVAKQLEDGWERSKSFTSISAAFARVKVLTRALQAARSATYGAHALNAVSIAFCVAGEMEQALHVAETITNKIHREHASIAIGQALVETENLGEAVAVAEKN